MKFIKSIFSKITGFFNDLALKIFLKFVNATAGNKKSDKSTVEYNAKKNQEPNDI